MQNRWTGFILHYSPVNKSLQTYTNEKFKTKTGINWDD